MINIPNDNQNRQDLTVWLAVFPLILLFLLLGMSVYLFGSDSSYGANQIALGSDYPFPLGEHHPGSLIQSMELDKSTKQRLLAGTALEWLGLNESDYIGK